MEVDKSTLSAISAATSQTPPEKATGPKPPVTQPKAEDSKPTEEAVKISVQSSARETSKGVDSSEAESEQQVDIDLTKKLAVLTEKAEQLAIASEGIRSQLAQVAADSPRAQVLNKEGLDIASSVDVVLREFSNITDNAETPNPDPRLLAKGVDQLNIAPEKKATIKSILGKIADMKSGNLSATASGAEIAQRETSNSIAEVAAANRDASLAQVRDVDNLAQQVSDRIKNTPERAISASSLQPSSVNRLLQG